VCFLTQVVGRSFQKPVSVHLEASLTVQPERDNPRDRNALLVVEPVSGAPVGHLPAAVAEHLGPILHKGAATAEATVTELPPREKSPLEIELRVTFSPNGGVGLSRQAAVLAARRAAEAATTLLEGGGGHTSGHRLRSNFETLVETVLKHDGALLGPEEHAFWKAYCSLGATAQCLFLRLCLRRGPLFRLQSLEYPDVPDAHTAALELERAQLAQCHALNTGTPTDHFDDGAALQCTWEEVARLLTVPELQEVLARLTMPELPHEAGAEPSRQTTRPYRWSGTGAAQLNRSATLAALQRCCNSSSNPAAQALATLLSASGTLLRLRPEALVSVCRLQRLFFLNEGHSLAQFLAVDTGAVMYPPYPLSRAAAAFPSRQHLLEYEAALAHAEELTRALEVRQGAAFILLALSLHERWQCKF